jgi:hypothetical protein
MRKHEGKSPIIITGSRIILKLILKRLDGRA